MLSPSSKSRVRGDLILKVRMAESEFIDPARLAAEEAEDGSSSDEVGWGP